MGAPGGSGGREVQGAGASASAVWGRAGPEEAKATVGSGECSVRASTLPSTAPRMPLDASTVSACAEGGCAQ